MRLVIILLTALAVVSKAARFGFGKPRPDTEGPSNQGPSNQGPRNQGPSNRQDGPDDLPGGNPGGGGGLGSVSENSVPSQEKIEVNMGGLEASLEKVQNVLEVAEVMVEVVSAIFADPDCVDEDAFTQGGLAVGTSTKCQSAAFTPSTTLPSTSFEACTSYASILDGCASATTSFYSLAPTIQASCACYSQSSSPLGCSGPKDVTMTMTATAKFMPARFDSAADACHSYFSVQGYENVAKALDGLQENATVLGAGFCGKLDEEIKSKGNGSVGLSTALPTVWTTQCVEYAVPASASGAKGSMLTRLNQSMLVVFAVIISKVPGFLFA